MNFYPHHIGDFRSGTVNMSRLSRWIYRDMLDVYYDTEKPLPMDTEMLCDMIGVEVDEEIKVVERLLRFKFVKCEDGYRHDRCDCEIAAYHQKAATARANGKAGGRPKKAAATDNKPSGFQSGSNSDADSNQAESGSKTNQEPITNKKKKETTSPAARVPSLSAPDLEGMGVENQTAVEFLAIRKRKRAPLTELAMDGIRREATAAGWTVNAALKKCIERGWQSFEASWVQPRASPTAQKFDPSAYVNRNRTPGHDARNTIDVEAKYVD